MKYTYTENSFSNRSDSLNSAKIIVPIILKLIKPRSVVDVGCGTGEFLCIFRKYGVKKILGIDGFWINKDKLKIPRDCYIEKNLEFDLSMSDTFDLALSMEVAEHLSKKSSEKFIKSLTKLAPIVVFSAAIPYQTGIAHINNQWPEYWANHFAKFGYVPIDCIRNKIWNNDQVSFWYAQNIILFVNKSYLSKNSLLKKVHKTAHTINLTRIHPKQYLLKAEKVHIISKLIPEPFLLLMSKLYSLFIHKDRI